MIIANCGGLKVDGTTIYEEDGVLKAQGGGGGAFVVTVNTNTQAGTATADKTYTELVTAINSGAFIKMILSEDGDDGIIYPHIVFYDADNTIYLNYTLAVNAIGMIVQIAVTSSNVWSIQAKTWNLS